jgi:hypothetical protein
VQQVTEGVLAGTGEIVHTLFLLAGRQTFNQVTISSASKKSRSDTMCPSRTR